MVSLVVSNGRSLFAGVEKNSMSGSRRSTRTALTFAGSAVTAHGKWVPRTTELLTFAAGKATVTLPPASAALLIAK